MVCKIDNNFFKLFFIHLPMSDCDTRIRHKFLELKLKLINSFHPVIEVKNLSLSIELMSNCVFHHIFIPLTDKSLNRKSVFRRSVDYRHIFNSGKRHIKRSRNWSCRHRNNINIFTQRF